MLLKIFVGIMKPQLILLLAALGGLVVVTTLAHSNNGEPQQQPGAGVQPSARANFVMPKLFDFRAFTVRFQKHYPNAVEMARRAKIFMARAFAVFISCVKYLKRKVSKFLRINPRIDWTPEERESSENHRLFSDLPQTTPDSVREPMPAIDPKEVERKLAEIVAHKDDSADYAAIAAALELGGGHDRRRRSPDLGDRKLSMEQLMGGSTKPIEESPKYTPIVSSNNPEYEQIEVASQGAYDNTQQVQPMSENEARRVDEQASLGGYLNGLLNSVKSAAVNLISGADPSVNLESDGEMSDSIESESERKKILRQITRPNELDQVYLDYRDTQCFLQPKEQGKCGSCYIFAATVLMEYHHCRQTDKLVPFSEQYAIDCSYTRSDHSNIHGCSGGFANHVGEFYGRYGLELSADYPYRAKEQTCPYSFTTEPAAMGHTKIESSEVVEINMFYLTSKMVTELLTTHGPLYIIIRTPDDFSDFGGGVDLNLCDTKKTNSHAMALIGHGIEDGLEYWLIRNSYGIQFGEQGHYKMSTYVRFGCVVKVGYVRGQFRKNYKHQGKPIFDELKKQNLLAKFAPVPPNLHADNLPM